MDEDIEFGRALAHGAVIGAANVAHGVTRADPELTETERASQQLAVCGLQLLGHVLVEVGAAAVQARRDQDA